MNLLPPFRIDNHPVNLEIPAAAEQFGSHSLPVFQNPQRLSGLGASLQIGHLQGLVYMKLSFLSVLSHPVIVIQPICEIGIFLYFCHQGPRPDGHPDIFRPGSEEPDHLRRGFGGEVQGGAPPPGMDRADGPGHRVEEQQDDTVRGENHQAQPRRVRHQGVGLVVQRDGQALAGIGGGMAVAAGAPAAIAAASEDPKSFGKSLIFVALGESIALYGVVISILILNKLV